MRFYRTQGWHDFEIEITETGHWLLKGNRGAKPPETKIPKPKKSQASYAKR